MSTTSFAIPSIVESRERVAPKLPVRGGIHRAIENFARTTPHALAVTDHESNQYTYAELNAAAEAVSASLRTSGIKRGERVAVCVGRTYKMAAAILGILKAGAAYVPIDPDYPKDRREYILGDCGASVVLAESQFAKLFSQKDREILILDVDPKAPLVETNRNPKQKVDADDPAYIIYTSGTTGEPKGVVISHGNLLNYVATLPQAIGLSSDDRYLHTASISFSSSARQLFLPLSLGASVVVASGKTIQDPRFLLDQILAQRVTVVDLVPSYWRTLLPTLDQDAIKNSDLRLLLSASEPLKKSVAERLTRMLGPDTRMFNMYGQTETTGIVFVSPLYSGREIDQPTVPIGRPIEDAAAHILNADLSQTPCGEIGELYVGGPGVGLGYLNRPELTAQRFIADPFTNTGSRLYRTGDLARYLPDGEIEHLGRVDDQVKIRGFRVEIREIESVISEYDDIRDVVVRAINDIEGDPTLVAYVVSESHSKIEVVELRRHLREKLPNYMIPATFVQLERMPLTPSGKTDRKAMPLPKPVDLSASDNFLDPQNETERRLAEIWCDVLGLQRVGIRDRFFEIGGHSLVAVKMFTILEQTFKKNIPLATLFEAGTIEELAAVLDRDDWKEPESCIVPIKPNGTRPPFFCMHAVGGNVMFYSDLAKYLHEDQPLYGLQARRLAGRQIGHPTIEEMAAHYLKEIREFCPDGPYYFAGSSFGGLIAYEMARQLHLEGIEVGLLALFDTSTPEYKRQLLPGTTQIGMKVDRIKQRARMHRDNLVLLNFDGKSKYVSAKAIKGTNQLTRKVKNEYKKWARQFYTKLKAGKSLPTSYIQLEDQLIRARKRYVPKPFPGNATLFRAKNQPYGLKPDPTLGWDLYLSSLEIHEVKGHHTSLVAEPYVSGLVARLNECLDALHAKH